MTVSVARIIGNVNKAGRISRYFEHKDDAVQYLRDRGYALPDGWNGETVTVDIGGDSLTVQVKTLTVR